VAAVLSKNVRDLFQGRHDLLQVDRVDGGKILIYPTGYYLAHVAQFSDLLFFSISRCDPQTALAFSTTEQVSFVGNKGPLFFVLVLLATCCAMLGNKVLVTKLRRTISFPDTAQVRPREQLWLEALGSRRNCIQDWTIVLPLLVSCQQPVFAHHILENRVE